MITCTKCEREQAEEEFYSHPRGKNGKHTWCRTCMARSGASRRTKNIEQYREYWRRSRRAGLQNPEIARRRKIVIRTAHRRDAGLLIEEPCLICRNTRDIQAHHESYDIMKPEHEWYVLWLCAPCHNRRHRKHLNDTDVHIVERCRDEWQKRYVGVLRLEHFPRQGDLF